MHSNSTAPRSRRWQKPAPSRAQSRHPRGKDNLRRVSEFRRRNRHLRNPPGQRSVEPPLRGFSILLPAGAVAGRKPDDLEPWMVFEELNVALPNHAGRAQNADWKSCFHSPVPSSVQEQDYVEGRVRLRKSCISPARATGSAAHAKKATPRLRNGLKAVPSTSFERAWFMGPTLWLGPVHARSTGGRSNAGAQRTRLRPAAPGAARNRRVIRALTYTSRWPRPRRRRYRRPCRAWSTAAHPSPSW